ncbi:MAG: molybdate ABC transporter substrate-binding protein [Desulfobacterales bacterium]|jgi:molybdate transport system substrate-binding protein|nr:molybdate ABC transporter substrate-binding protein [Desulfobacteraceae bacterium]MDD3991671.1 molybdate ABC transporter substrate-binding protein [Desulfobacteraceae bacterium]MDY0311153.1 molybdate ABC transporter substrate-binding protein [Desulfobacterales bacterium]
MKPKLSLAIGCCLLLWFAAPSMADESGSVTVFAAASTTNALNDVIALFTERGLGTGVPSYASSSTLAKQIENGAPADIYVSANAKWMEYLEARGLVASGTRVDLLSNRVVLIVPADSPVEAVSLEVGVDLAALLGDGHLAMGDPDHVPIGNYGRQAMEKFGAWAAVAPKLARAKTTRAALAMVERGEAPLGVVFATDAAISRKVRVVGRFPADSHGPIIYPVAIVAGHETAAAKRFMDFLTTPEALAAFEKYGFTIR